MNERRAPFGLVVTGEAQSWQPALEQIVGREWLITYRVQGRDELLQVVQAGVADAAVLDDTAEMGMDAMQMLRLIRRLDAMLPVVIVSGQVDRRFMENALKLAAFSVVQRPLELEELLRQLSRMMQRLDEMLRGE
ncbi:MAG: response regulator [Phycisphaerae bacterium]|nr:response regulator [Phycisphaerae bacterium]